MTQLVDIKKLHQQGKLVEARQGYLRLLEENPADAEALHLLAIVCAEEDNFHDAITYLEQAISLLPDNLSLRLNLANILKSQNNLAEAESVLLDIISVSPRFAGAENNLGTIYYLRGEWAAAIAAFQQAIDIQPDYVDAYYNLGLALTKDKRYVEALHVYDATLSLAEDHAGALFQRSCLLMQQSKFKLAIEGFIKLENVHPHHLETQMNVATCYLRLGMLPEAKLHYLKAHDLNPKDVQLLFNLGVINMQQSRIQDAIQYYQQALCLQPDFFAGHNNLGAAYLAIRDHNMAILHFREAARLHPDDEAVKHTLSILTGKQPLLTAPPEYIHSLFDSYAERYDAHVVDVLHYQVPVCLVEAVASAGLTTHHDLDILDLGCGTGLCGDVFKPYAASLVGVDLSVNMLAVAQAKNIYNDLIQSDIVAFIKQSTMHYDLVLAGDVIGYLADLNELFKNIGQVMRPGGLFAFTVETGADDKDFMPISGRFQHSKRYIQQLANENHLELVSCIEMALRTQDQKPVPGLLFVLQH
jgi:predicted TPR repeat methyltransferase